MTVPLVWSRIIRPLVVERGVTDRCNQYVCSTVRDKYLRGGRVGQSEHKPVNKPINLSSDGWH